MKILVKYFIKIISVHSIRENRKIERVCANVRDR